jgi:cytidylate kinase
LSNRKNDENAYNSVLKEILERDHRDMNREFAPLTRTNNQLLLDATNLSPEQAINHITDYINLINKKMND